MNKITTNLKRMIALIGVFVFGLGVVPELSAQTTDNDYWSSLYEPTDKVQIVADLTNISGVPVSFNKPMSTYYVAGSDVYYWTFTAITTNSSPIRFGVLIDGVEYQPQITPGNDDIAAGKPSDDNAKATKANGGQGNIDRWTVQCKVGYTYTIKVILNYNNVEGDHRVWVVQGTVGDASITADTRENGTFAMYLPKLNNIYDSFDGVNNLPDKLITSLYITPYSADRTKVFPSVFEFKYDGTTKVADFDSLFAKLAGEDKNNNKEHWVHDDTLYPNGIYIYEMTMTIEGYAEVICVKSNRFWIKRTVHDVSANSYQLVKLLSNEGTYVTYRVDNGVFQPAYLVTVSDNGNVGWTPIETPDYADGSKYQFTDQVLIVSENPTLNATELLGFKIDSSDYSKDGIQDDSGRLMLIKSLSDLEKKEFNLYMKYNVTDWSNYPSLSTTEKETEKPASTSIALTIPTPRIEKAGYELKCIDGGTKSFSYESYNFSGRYHELREAVVIDKPNATEELKKLYPQGLFTVKVRDKEVADNYVGDALKTPEQFDDNSGDVTLTTGLHTCAIFNRWKDEEIGAPELTYHAPSGFVTFATAEGCSLGYDTEGDHAGNLVERIHYTIKANDETINTLDGQELLHKGDYDYYLVSFYMKGVGDNTFTPVEGHEFVMSHKDLVDGKSGDILIDYGHWYDTQYDDVNNELAARIRLRVDVSRLYPFNTASENVQSTNVLEAPAKAVSFTSDIDGTVEGQLVPESCDPEGNVIRSNKLRLKLADITTSVDGIESVKNSVKTGVGFIEVSGNNVAVYSVAGTQMAVGAGRHSVESGVYLVRVDGRTHKVIVR